LILVMSRYHRPLPGCWQPALAATEIIRELAVRISNAMGKIFSNGKNLASRMEGEAHMVRLLGERW
jgi:hypothetical protein